MIIANKSQAIKNTELHFIHKAQRAIILGFLSLGLFSSMSVAQSQSDKLSDLVLETTPSDFATFMERMEWAVQQSAILAEFPSERDVSVSVIDRHHIMLTLIFAVDTSSIGRENDSNQQIRLSWQDNPQYLQSLESLIENALKADLCSSDYMPLIFQGIALLPDSPKLSPITVDACSKGSPVRLWIRPSLITRVSDSEIKSIRDRVLNIDIDSVQTWELAFLAINGTQSDTDTISILYHKAKEAGAHLPPLSPTGRLSQYLRLLLDLQRARQTPEALLNWAIQMPGVGNNREAIWAFNEVMRKEGVSSPVWNGIWDKLQIESIAKAQSYSQRSSIALSSNQQDIYIAHWLRPWITWADENSLVVPHTIRNLSPSNTQATP